MSAQAKWTILFFFLAIFTSLFRFGELENENLPYQEGIWYSDSHAYIDMATTFAGEKATFDEKIFPIKTWHYNRPGYPFAAAVIYRIFPALSIRSALSLVNLFSAFGTAVLLMLITKRECYLEEPWLPSVLFLLSFPQLNWGYNILTDTYGLFLALYSSYLIVKIVCDRSGLDLEIFFFLFVIASAGFLVRETQFISLIFVTFLTGFLILDGNLKWKRAAVCMIVVFLAKIPSLCYTEFFNLHGPIIHITKDHIKITYWLDFLIKSAISFNIVWLAAGFGFFRAKIGKQSKFLIGWSAGALLYMLAGFFHNSLNQGYPMRLTFSLFPAVLILAAIGLETLFAGKNKYRYILIFVIFYFSINVLGYLTDPGTKSVTIERYLQDWHFVID